jgi:sec-independent protein translocase protein TatA
MPGPLEIVAILLVVLLLFGAKRIPEIARGLGSGIREFKDATNDIKREVMTDSNHPHAPRQQPQLSQPRQPHQSAPLVDHTHADPAVTPAEQQASTPPPAASAQPANDVPPVQPERRA